MWWRIRSQAALVTDLVAVYGMHFASQALPLVTVPYLTRTLGPASWGLLAMAQSFGTYGNVLVDYGFLFSASRNVVQAESALEVERIIAGVSAAKLLLGAATLGAAFLVYLLVPVFRENPLLLSMAVVSEIVKALLPVYYFYGIKRVALESLFDITARSAAAAGIFVFVKAPVDGWKVFALSGIAALVAMVASHLIIRQRYRLPKPDFAEGWRMLREGWAMFVFRSAYSAYTLGNAFVLGLFASPQIVGYYAGAEKIGSAAVGVLNPLTTVLYPRAAELAKSSPRQAARVARVTLYLVGLASLVLAALLWFAAPLIIRLILGQKFQASESVLRVLSLRAPFVAWTNVLGFQWLLTLGLEQAFQQITLAALVLNLVLAACLAPAYAAVGMAWAVVISQAVAAGLILLVLERRSFNPLRGLGSLT